MELWTAPIAGWVEVQKEAATWYEKAMRDGTDSLQRAAGAIVQTGARSPAGHGGRSLEPPRAAA